VTKKKAVLASTGQTWEQVRAGRSVASVLDDDASEEDGDDL
jgi:hypothetical protein